MRFTNSWTLIWRCGMIEWTKEWHLMDNNEFTYYLGGIGQQYWSNFQYRDVCQLNDVVNCGESMLCWYYPFHCCLFTRCTHYKFGFLAKIVYWLHMELELLVYRVFNVFSFSLIHVFVSYHYKSLHKYLVVHNFPCA